MKSRQVNALGVRCVTRKKESWAEEMLACVLTGGGGCEVVLLKKRNF